MIPADLHPRINLLLGVFEFESYGFLSLLLSVLASFLRSLAD